MGKKCWRAIGILIIVLMMCSTGCAARNDRQLHGDTAKGKIVVYASIYPIYDFAVNIGKDRIDARLVVPPGAEPHEWEPSARFMADLEKADVFIYNGAGMEAWVHKLLGAVNNKALITVEASEGIKLLRLQEHRHSGQDGHSSEYDPHIWLSPVNAIKQAENIKNAIVKADPENKDYYEANYEEFAAKLAGLDGRYMQGLSKLQRKEMVVAHAAFGYLAYRYGLEQIPITGLSPQEEPSAAKLAEIARFSKEHGLRYIFFETLTNPRLAEVLAREVGAETAVLNPIGGLTEEEIEAGKDYVSIMDENLEVLIRALGE